LLRPVPSKQGGCAAKFMIGGVLNDIPNNLQKYLKITLIKTSTEGISHSFVA
jgi:hypothetical protein